MNCSSGNQDTYCNVTIQMNGALQSVAANTTFNGLTSNMMYPISARAINRCGDYSETTASYWTCKSLLIIGMTSSWCIVSVPEAPLTSTISVIQSLINESATQLNISWSHIVSLCILLCQLWVYDSHCYTGWQCITVCGQVHIWYEHLHISSISPELLCCFELCIWPNCENNWYPLHYNHFISEWWGSGFREWSSSRYITCNVSKSI